MVKRPVVKQLGLAVAALTIVASSHSLLAEPTTRPVDATTRPMRPFGDRRPDGPGPRQWRERIGTFDPAASLSGPMTEREKEDIRGFLREYSPNRLKRLEDVPDTREDGIYRRIAHQYRTLQRIKDEDRQIYDLRMKRLPIEDQMFALAWELRHDDQKDSKVAKDPAELRSKLREQVKLFVESALEERRIRLERSEAKLKQEQVRIDDMRKQLDRLTSDKEAVIERGLADTENEKPNAFRDLLFGSPGGNEKGEGREGREKREPAPPQP